MSGETPGGGQHFVTVGPHLLAMASRPYSASDLMEGVSDRNRL